MNIKEVILFPTLRPRKNPHSFPPLTDRDKRLLLWNYHRRFSYKSPSFYEVVDGHGVAELENQSSFEKIFRDEIDSYLKKATK